MPCCMNEHADADATERLMQTYRANLCVTYVHAPVSSLRLTFTYSWN